MHPKNYLNPEWESTFVVRSIACIVTCYEFCYSSISYAAAAHTWMFLTKGGLSTETSEDSQYWWPLSSILQSGSLESKHIRSENICVSWVRWLLFCFGSVSWSHDNAIVVWCKAEGGSTAWRMRREVTARSLKIKSSMLRVLSQEIGNRKHMLHQSFVKFGKK